tara:strand:- start:624 stop:1463 length:840 start_codon:yes stop_codon:yes gene_type:complete
MTTLAPVAPIVPPAAVSPTQAPSPNGNWQNNATLDSNGNPITNQTPVTPVAPTGDVAPVKPVEPVTESPTTSTVDMSATVVKQVEQLIVDAGLTASEVALAVQSGGGQVTPAIMQALVAKHGEAVASLVANQLESLNTSNIATASAKDTAVYTQVKEAFKDLTEQGGKESWTELAGWAKTNIPDAERQEINVLLGQGGLAATYAINDLVSRFKSSDSFTQSAGLLEGGNTNKESGAAPLSKADYLREFRKLEAEGHNYGQSQELDKLDQRREAGMKRGI